MTSTSVQLFPSFAWPKLLPGATACAVWLTLGIAALGLVGCDGPANTFDTTSSDIGSAELDNATDDLSMAFASLNSVSEGGGEAAAVRALHYLNQWLSRLDQNKIENVAHPLKEFLPSIYKTIEPLQGLDRLAFQQSDLLYLRQAVWLRACAQRVAKQPDSAELEAWLKAQQPEIEAAQKEKLALAARLFEWTISQIRLDKMPPPPKGAVATVGKNPGRTPLESRIPAERGEPGPGYQQVPWETLVMGHGDAFERSRVFIALARQVGLEVVMLAVPAADGTTQFQPWLTALVANGQLYLFDCELGIPLPDQTATGIATLAQVLAQPEMLATLEISGEAPYRVKPADLREIHALVDAEPLTLSLRMKLLEGSLPEALRLSLSCSTTEIESALKKMKGVRQVALWKVSLDAALYQTGRAERWQQDPAAQQTYLTETFMFSPSHPMLMARQKQFLGAFTGSDKDPGARQIYMEMRTPQRQMDALETSTQARKEARMGDGSLSSDPAQRAFQLAQITLMNQRMKFLKRQATYWIALSHLEDGNPAAAEEWLKDRILEGDADSQWAAGARQNLARCYEREGNWEAAQKLYLADKSPQRVGSRIRAREIAKLHPPAESTGSSAPKPTEETSPSSKIPPEEPAKEGLSPKP